MRESATDLQRLQRLLDNSVERASPFLRASFQLPERSLSAEQLTAHLRSAVTVALATVTSRGEPRVAPINALFLRGQFHVPTVAEAARARHLAHRPAASLTYFQGTELAVIAHGRAELIGADQPQFGELDELQVQLGGESVRGWHGHGVYLRLHAASLYTYAREPDHYPTRASD